MIRFIKRLWRAYTLLDHLNDAEAVRRKFGEKVEKLEKEVELLRSVDHVRAAVASILGRDIAWYDYEQLAPAQWIDYYQAAQESLRSPVVLNEINYGIAQLMKLATIENKENDPQKLRDIRMMMLGIKSLEDRLREIKPYTEPRPPRAVDLHTAI